MKKILIYYCFTLTTIMSLMGFLGARSYQELISAVLYYPLAVFFALLIIPRNKRALQIPRRITPKPKSPSLPLPTSPTSSISKINTRFQATLASKPTHSPALISKTISVSQPEDPIGIDQDRRQFIKLIGSAGLSVFLMSLFTKKAQAAFFGSVPGPGSVTLKDPETGQQISPAIRTPTDGYKISQIDDSVPAYYGFVNKTGEWFIMREDSGGNYRYTQGSSNFISNWNNRSSLSYDTFDVIF